MTDIKMTPALRQMLERIRDHGKPMLELLITASGGRAHSNINKLRRAGWINQVDHPTVIDRGSGYPADALVITPEGLAALECKP